jgi:hypothetical protein
MAIHKHKSKRKKAHQYHLKNLRVDKRFKSNFISKHMKGVTEEGVESKEQLVENPIAMAMIGSRGRETTRNIEKKRTWKGRVKALGQGLGIVKESNVSVAVDNILTGKNEEAREVLQAHLGSYALDALEQKKAELAAAIFTGHVKSKDE